MTENEFLLFDRVEKIKSVIGKYGDYNFFISFSGGKDSTVLSWLIDYVIPNNKIPRVYADTGIELNMIRDFVYHKAEYDKRFEIIKPQSNIKQTLDEYGYPFKSKMHSAYVKKYQTKGMEYKSVRAYTRQENTLAGVPMFRPCPKKLLYQFTNDFNIKISDACCLKMKEEPIAKWAKENNKKYSILGIMREEGGRRFNAQCLKMVGKNLKNFQPLAVVTKEWEEWLIDKYSIDICDIYKPPYNFKRTGCKGCPFARDLQKELETLKEFFPAERKQCEYIWKPIYDEYRRIGYRLKK